MTVDGGRRPVVVWRMLMLMLMLMLMPMMHSCDRLPASVALMVHDDAEPAVPKKQVASGGGLPAGAKCCLDGQIIFRQFLVRFSFMLLLATLQLSNSGWIEPDWPSGRLKPPLPTTGCFANHKGAIGRGFVELCLSCMSPACLPPACPLDLLPC